MQPPVAVKGQSVQVPGTIVTFLALAEDTGGAFSLFEGRVAPRQGPPLHRHNDDEAFLILEGNFQLQIAEQHLQVGPGGFVLVSKHTPHTYLNADAEKEGHLLIITLPGGFHERFFAEIGKHVVDPKGPFSPTPPDIERLVAAGRRYGIEILLPGAGV
jgi:quercetin dioxygenase-like cupin family protein